MSVFPAKPKANWEASHTQKTSVYVIFSMHKRALVGASDFFSVEAGLSTLLTAGMMPSLLVPRPRLHATSIFFLVTSPLISRSTVLTAEAASIHLALKHLAKQPPLFL